MPLTAGAPPQCPKDGGPLSALPDIPGGGRCNTCDSIWLPYQAVIRKLGHVPKSPKPMRAAQGVLRCPLDGWAFVATQHHRGPELQVCSKCAGLWLAQQDYQALSAPVHPDYTTPCATAPGGAVMPDTNVAPVASFTGQDDDGARNLLGSMGEQLQDASSRALNALEIVLFMVIAFANLQNIIRWLVGWLLGPHPGELGFGGMIFVLAGFFIAILGAGFAAGFQRMIGMVTLLFPLRLAIDAWAAWLVAHMVFGHH